MSNHIIKKIFKI